MMAAAWYPGRAAVRHRWRALLAVALLVGLVSGVVMAAVAGARRTSSSYDRFRAASNADDAFLQAFGIDAGLVERALDHPTVAGWTGASFYIGTAGTERDFGVIASPDGRFGTTITRAKVLDGRRVDPEASDEIMINEATVEEVGVGVGGTIRFGALSPEQLLGIEEDFFGEYEGPTIPLRVVGVFRAPEDLHNSESFGDIGGVATPAFDRRYEEVAGHFEGLYAVDLVDGVDDVEAFEANVADVFPPGAEWGIESAEQASGAVRDALRVLTSGLLLFGACAALAGGVAAGQALARHLAAEGEDQEPLAALGLSRLERAAGVVAPAAILAVGGAIVAVVVAVAVSPLFPIGLGRRAEPDLGVDVDVPVLLAGAVLVALLAALRALATAWSMTRDSADGARDRPSAVARTMARIGAGPAKVTGVRMAFEPGRGRSRVPVRPALLGAVAGVLGVAAAVTFATSLDRLVDTPERWGWNWDVAPDTFTGDLERFAEEPEVTDAGLIDFGFVRVEGRGVAGYAVKVREGAPSLSVLDGRAPVGGDEVVLGPELLDRLNREVGDTVELARAFGARGEPLVLRIVGTGLFPTFETDEFTEGAFLTPGGLDTVRQSDGFERAILSFDPDTDPTDARERLAEEYPKNFSVYALPEPPGDVDNLAQVNALPWVLCGFLGVLALAAVAHALAVSVRRRRGELAVLRAVGFRRRQTRAVVGWQATSLALVGAAVGLPLGIAVGRLAWSLVARRLGVLDDPALPVPALAVLPLATLVLANLTAALPARRASALKPALGLRSE
ncbi:hypothetical protein BH18ACT1_BH18ACT1_13560 [soil metagenome]